MYTHISKHAKQERLEAFGNRYNNVSKIEKTRILDEFVALPVCHRKPAIRLLAGVDPIRHDAHAPSRRISSDAVPEALIVRWEAADCIRGKRLQAILPTLVCELVPTVVPASHQGPGGGQGQEAGSPARDPLRAPAGASRGRDHRPGDAPSRFGCAGSVGAVASDPRNPVRSGRAGLGRAGCWSGTGESGWVSRQTPRGAGAAPAGPAWPVSRWAARHFPAPDSRVASGDGSVSRSSGKPAVVGAGRAGAPGEGDCEDDRAVGHPAG